MEHKICPNKKCDAMSTDSKFCYKCGTEQIDAPRCKCKRWIGKCDNFCPDCGRPVR